MSVLAHLLAELQSFLHVPGFRVRVDAGRPSLLYGLDVGLHHFQPYLENRLAKNEAGREDVDLMSCDDLAKVMNRFKGNDLIYLTGNDYIKEKSLL